MNYVTIKIKSKKIFTNSYSTKQDILRYFPISPDKIEVVGYASLYKSSENTISKENYFLFIGNEKTHKNLEKVINAFLEFLDIIPYMNLIIIGSFSHKIKHPNIIYKGYLSEKKIKSFYHRAIAVLFPSLKEGFGIPILDANSMRTPVITSDFEPMNYVAGGVFYSCDPFSHISIKKVMFEVFFNKSYSKKITIYGYKNKERFSFSNMANKIEKELQKCL